jgi:biopolymer transport protein ExbD
MNVVPLIDILLVLLIIFMVITPLTPKGLDTLVRSQSEPAAEPGLGKQDGRRAGHKDSKVKINNEDPLGKAWAAHRTDFKDRAEKVAFVKGDNEVLFQEVARASTSCALGIDKVGLITAKLEAGSKQPGCRPCSRPFCFPPRI